MCEIMVCVSEAEPLRKAYMKSNCSPEILIGERIVERKRNNHVQLAA